MIRNYFKIAWRNLIKNKGYSLINISGLAIGMGIVLLIGLWIGDEITYNKSFGNYDRLVKVEQNSTHGGNILTYTSVPIPLSDELRTKYGADFKQVVMTSFNDTHTLAFGDKLLNKSGMFAQPEIVDLLTLKMIRGSRAALNDPSSLLISQSLATAIFGQEDPINKSLKLDNKRGLKVAGVFEDFPYNSEFRETGFLAPWAYYEADQPSVKTAGSQWFNNGFQIYAQLQDQTDINTLGAKIKGALKGHDRKDKPEVVLYPMSRWHLYDEFKNGINTGGAIQFVWMFGIIGAFVLLLACINFMNLSTARSEKRAKEVGIRKAVGSLRNQLVLQFLGESVLIAFLSFVVAILLARLSLPWFNQLADKQMIMPWGNAWFWIPAIGFTVFTGLVSGSYPAFYLSSFSTVKVLKGNRGDRRLRTRKERGTMLRRSSHKVGRFARSSSAFGWLDPARWAPRKILIVLQFSVSISLIIGTIIVFQQIAYVKSRPIGYARTGLLTVNNNTTDLQLHYNAVRDELIRSGVAANAAQSSSPTTGVNLTKSGFSWTGKDPNLVPNFVVMYVTHDFGKTVGWQTVDGRDFSRDFASDSTGMILNESAAKYMGLSHPVGETVKYLTGKIPNQDYRVVGVVKDIVMESPFTPVRPTIFMIDYPNASVLTVKVNPALSVSQALPQMAAILSKYSPGSPFDYTFTDIDYAKKFAMEERVGNLATFFAVFAIFISCLGLSGLASFLAEQRTKEIGVRKILGASVLQLWGLLSTEFLKLVFVSFLIALPLSYYGMHNWLLQYDYRVAISAWVFVITILLALCITLLTVSVQSIRAAVANPVKSLRSE
jgi:putative ABC transport system permease protein